MDRRHFFGAVGGVAAVAAMGPVEWPEFALLNVPGRSPGEPGVTLTLFAKHVGGGRYQSTYYVVNGKQLDTPLPIDWQFDSPADLQSASVVKFITNAVRV